MDSSCPPGNVDDHEIPNLHRFLKSVTPETVNEEFVFVDWDKKEYKMCPLAMGLANSWPGSGTELVCEFIKMGANVNWVQPETGYSIFQYACWNLDSVKSLQMLIDAGADISHKDIFGRTALDMVTKIANHYGMEEIYEFLRKL
jgi:hypothetical protein